MEIEIKPWILAYIRSCVPSLVELTLNGDNEFTEFTCTLTTCPYSFDFISQFSSGLTDLHVNVHLTNQNRYTCGYKVKLFFKAFICESSSL